MLSDFLANQNHYSQCQPVFLFNCGAIASTKLCELVHVSSVFYLCFQDGGKNSDSVRIANYIKLNTDLFMKFHDRMLHKAHV